MITIFTVFFRLLLFVSVICLVVVSGTSQTRGLRVILDDVSVF